MHLVDSRTNAIPDCQTQHMRNYPINRSIRVFWRHCSWLLINEFKIAILEPLLAYISRECASSFFGILDWIQILLIYFQYLNVDIRAGNEHFINEMAFYPHVRTLLAIKKLNRCRWTKNKKTKSILKISLHVVM